MTSPGWQRRMFLLLGVAALAGCSTQRDALGDTSWHPGRVPIVLASWYGDRFHGRRTASGERFDRDELTAAHPTLPFGTWLRVRSVDTGREVVVRINDRGPNTGNRAIDLSHAAAEALGVRHRGVFRVQLLPE